MDVSAEVVTVTSSVHGHAVSMGTTDQVPSWLRCMASFMVISKDEPSASMRCVSMRKALTPS